MFWRLSHPRQWAIDELAVSLEIDPLGLRLRCYSDRNQNTDQQFSSKALAHFVDAADDSDPLCYSEMWALSQITPVVGRSDAG